MDLVHCGVGVNHPLHQPLELTVTYELVPSQVSGEKRTHPRIHSRNKQQKLLRSISMPGAHLIVIKFGNPNP